MFDNFFIRSAFNESVFFISICERITYQMLLQQTLQIIFNFLKYLLKFFERLIFSLFILEVLSKSTIKRILIILH